MCGIAGLWRRAGIDPTDRKRLCRMAGHLVHRGPDDFGYCLASSDRGDVHCGQEVDVGFEPDVLLASRRLSLIDLTAAGRQPIANETNDVFVVFNGAIHNYVELRADLEARGHMFRSRTDTEVIVHAYEEWGEDCARRFNGMWAYVVWDHRSRRLVCSRDRFGIKPLCVAWAGDTFYFASEAKAILAAGEVKAAVRPAFLEGFLAHRGDPWGERTPFAGIKQLLPAHNLVITRDGARVSRYWSYQDRSQVYDFHRPEQTFRELFADAVRLRLRSDVPIALLLSGGLDSSSIAAFVGRESAVNPLAFTAAFPGFSGDEMRFARCAAAHSGIALAPVAYDVERFPDDLASAAWHMDAPPYEGQILARWQLLDAVRPHAKVVLEGQGADEMLGGYPGRYLGSYVASEVDQIDAANFLPTLQRIFVARFRWSRSWARLVPHWPKRRRGRMNGTPFPDSLTAHLYQDHSLTILPRLLHFGDAISMAHSVESRLPFLDHRLVEFVFGLPFGLKIRGGETKCILRKALAPDLAPQIMRRRDKIGFLTPLDLWLRQHLDQHVRPVLTSKRARERGIFDSAMVRSALARLEKSGRSAHFVFRAYALERWLELFIDGDGFRDRQAAIG